MSEHEISFKAYTIVFVLLMVLLAISAVAAQSDLAAPWDTVVAIGISVAKAILVALFFMHIISSSALTRVFAVGGLVWLGFLLVLAMSDYTTRSVETPAPAQYQPTPLDRAVWSDTHE